VADLGRRFGAVTGADGPAHGVTLFPNDLSKSATAKMDAFLNRVLG